MPTAATSRSGVRVRERLATAMRRERAKRGWTQVVAAETAGLDPRHWRKLEAREVNFTARTLERLCKAFGLDVLDLFAVDSES